MAKSYLHQIRAYNVRQAWPTPEKAALLVIDMQLYFKDIAQPIVDNVISLIECFRANNRKIFFTRHGHPDPKTDGGILASLKNLAYGFAHIVNTKDLRQILEIT